MLVGASSIRVRVRPPLLVFRPPTSCATITTYWDGAGAVQNMPKRLTSPVS